MLSYKVTVRNPSGLHLRPAGLLCGEAIKYKSSITFQYAGGTANAKSVLSVLGACVKNGDEITLVCEGEDEQAAIDALVALIEGGLGEGYVTDTVIIYSSMIRRDYCEEKSCGNFS